MPNRCGKRQYLFVWSALALVKRNSLQSLIAVFYNWHWRNFFTGNIYQGPWKAICVPGLNCYSCPGAWGACPIGSLQSAYSGTVLRFPFYVLGLMLAWGLLFGRVICGWLCPFGFLQELLYALPSRKIKKRPWMAKLTYIKYGILVLFVVVIPLLFYGQRGRGTPAFCKYICPAGIVEGAIPLFATRQNLWQLAGWITTWKFAVCFFLLGLAIVMYRPFCRFICPLGAWYGFFHQTALLGVTVDSKKCIHCHKCALICKNDVQIAGDRECVSCGECLATCPTRAISYRHWPRKRVRENKKINKGW